MARKIGGFKRKENTGDPGKTPIEALTWQELRRRQDEDKAFQRWLVYGVADDDPPGEP